MSEAPDPPPISPRLLIAALGWLVGASVGGFAWAVNVSSELAVHKALIAQLREDNTRQDLTSLEAARAIKDELRELRSEFRNMREALQQRNGKP